MDITTTTTTTTTTNTSSTTCTTTSSSEASQENPTTTTTTNSTSPSSKKPCRQPSPTHKLTISSCDISPPTHRLSTSSAPAPANPSQSLALIPFTGSFPLFPLLFASPSSSASAPPPHDDRKPRRTAPDGAPRPPEADGEEEKKSESYREPKKRSKNWTRFETLILIRLRTEFAPRFAKQGRKSELWDEISAGLQRSGFLRDAQQCRDKWEKLMAGYKEVSDGGKRREDNPYFDELHPLLSRRLLKRERETSQEAPAQSDDKLPEAPLRDSSNLDRPDGGGEDKEQTGSVGKKRKVGLMELHAVQALLETIIVSQQTYFNELLDSIEQKEQLREQIRLEREEKWREEERIQRGAFTNAMMILTQKLTDGDRAAAPMPPPPTAGAVATSVTPFPAAPALLPVLSPTEQPGPKKRSKNWKRGEVLQLIELRGEMEDRFAKSTRRAVLWEELAESLRARGIKRDAKQCREKWDKLMSEYKDVCDGKKDKGDSSYFSEIKASLPGGSAA